MMITNSSKFAHSVPVINIARRFVKNKKVSRVVIHQSQRPPFPKDVEYNTLNLTHTVQEKPNAIVSERGWSTPPEKMPDLPFQVVRTLASKSLPVYTDYKHGRTKVQTMVRNIRGDITTLKSDMEKVVGAPVMIKPGKLVVDGNYVMRLKIWLTNLGF